MKQQIPKVLSHVGYGSTQQFAAIHDGVGAVVVGTSKAPMPVAGIVRNLTAYCGDARAVDITVTIWVNGSAMTPQVVLSPSDIDPVVDPLHAVAFAAGDYVRYKVVITGDPLAIPGLSVGVCVEVETAQDMCFGISAGAGTFGPGSGNAGGAFGNGVYSIAAMDCAVVGLMLRRFATPSGGAWRGRIVLDSVVQDGTGGTIDTTCTLDDAGPDTVLATFDLPVGFTQHVQVFWYRDGSEAPFASEQVGMGIRVRPAIPGRYMFCGGSNDVVTSVSPTWKWNGSRQEAANESEHTAPVGRTGFQVLGMYIERTFSLDNGRTDTHTLLRNGLPTSLVVPITDPAVTGLVVGREYFPGGGAGLITIRIEDSGDPPNGLPKLFWGAAVAPILGVIGPLVWVHVPRVQP